MTKLEYLETHISWVVLTGPFAYKIKKPVDLGFVDFSTLQRRRHFCGEEVRLNRRWAPELYLGVVEIHGSTEHAAIGGDGPLIDYAVKMLQFPQDARLDAQLESGALDGTDMTSLGDMLAGQHAKSPVWVPETDPADLAYVKTPMFDNFDDLAQYMDRTLLQKIENWTTGEFDALRSTLLRREKQHRIRECHGDLHLGNLVRLDSGICAFDCVEFSPELRNIDVISDVAFLVMDLVARRREDLAYRFLNRYLEVSGDYDGMRVFDLYFVYHCLIRAKVAAIRGGGRSKPADADRDMAEVMHYLGVAERCMARPPPVLIAMHGFSGSGKTHLSSQLVAALPALRVRSDIERKRAHAVAEKDSSESGVAQGIYTDDASRTVYETLADLATTLLNSGHSVIVDAAFMKARQRDLVWNLAGRLNVRFLILDIQASMTELARRVKHRQRSGSDASEAGVDVLYHQLQTCIPLTQREQGVTVSVDTEGAVCVDSIVRDIRRRLHGAGGSARCLPRTA